MSNKINGYREETLKGLTTGAAVAFEDFDLATDTYETGKKNTPTHGTESSMACPLIPSACEKMSS